MISTAFKTSILASLAAAATAAAATDYWAITPVAGTTDAMNASSLSGYTSANGAPVGWAAEKGSDVVAVAGITEENAVYHVWQDELVHRSPAGNQGQGVFATPSSSSIVIEDNCTWDVVGKIANGGVLTLNNLSVKGGATFYYRTNSDSTSNERQTVAGSIDMAEGSLAKFNSYVQNSTKTTYLTKAATLSATMTGRGRITMFRGAAAISGTGNEMTANSSKAIVQQITGDISGFTGDLEVYGEGTQRNVTLQLVNAASLPGDPEPEELSYVIVTNGATLQINHDWVSPTNRIWILGSSGQPTIYVAAGKTVTINGPVIGTVGLTKTGDGTLLINDRSRLYGTMTVSAGKAPRFVYITPDADGTGNGSSWASPMMLTNYLADIKNDDTVRIKSGYYKTQIQSVTFGGAMTVKISGGYAGTDDTTLDEDFPYSDIDFAHYPNNLTYSPFLCKANAGYSVSFERLLLRRARNAPFYKTNNGGSLYLSDCVVVSNGWRNYNGSTSAGGRGIHAEAGKLFMTNCVIAYNGMYSYPSGYTSSYGDHGFGVYLKNTQAEMVGCKIYGNGSRINLDATDGAAHILRGGGRGMAVYATGSTVLKAVDCDFVCNKAPMGTYNTSTESATGIGAGGTVAFYSATGNGSSFSNCSFIANMNVRDHAYGRYNINYGGALAVHMGAADRTVNVDNCTFAYNLTDSPSVSAGIDVWMGVVNVRNSVFVGNHKPSGSSIGSDIHVRTGAVVNVSHTLFDATGADDARHFTTQLIGEDSGTLNMGAGVTFGDALLASETFASTNLIQTYSKKIQSATFTCLRYKVANIDEVLAFDVHPRSKAGRWTAAGYAQDKEHSPAIDAGDPAAPFGDEPRPNGRRLNLGRYGGTAEASLTLTGGTVLLVQ